MRCSIIATLSAVAIASVGAYGSAHAQGVEVYVGPSLPYSYAPPPYVEYGYAPPAYGYYEYSSPYVVYRPGRIRCEGTYRRWNGNHCVDLQTLGTSQP
jgi:hypothetical protein